jgi:lycopene beta-cyclase
MPDISNTYDYIFAGGGCAAYSLVMRMLQEPALKDKRILIIDKDVKNQNDRTWSYWSKTEDIFDNLACKQWQHLRIGYHNKFVVKNIAPYKYFTIRGIDFYNYCQEAFALHNNIKIVHDQILNIQSTYEAATVKAVQATCEAQYVFNSILSVDTIAEQSEQFLWQHFLGYVIETPEPVFDDTVATWMDFNVPQQNGATFMYVLPFTKHKALVEYTIFSDTVLQSNIYEKHVQDYLSKLHITNYDILEIEFDKIPMTTHRFVRTKKNIINIGINGGATRASTGFTFLAIQKQTKHLITQLLSNKPLQYKYSFQENKHMLFDKTLLHLLLNNKLSGEDIFARLFERNPVTRVLSFINGDTSFKEELALMNTVQKGKFIPAFFKELLL